MYSLYTIYFFSFLSFIKGIHLISLLSSKTNKNTFDCLKISILIFPLSSLIILASVFLIHDYLLK